MSSLCDRLAALSEERGHYVLRDLTYHLAEAGMWKELAEVFAEPDFVLARSQQFGFASIHADALSASQSNQFTDEWRDAYIAWERFLRWRVERLRPTPEAYASEVVNEFLPRAPEPLLTALQPLRNQYFASSALKIKKVLGPPALGAGHVGTVYSAAFSPDDRFLVLGSDDWTVKVWDAQLGEQVAECVGHRSAVRAVAYSPDGKRVASGGNDRTVKVWDIPSGRLVADCIGHQGFVTALAFSSDAKVVASGAETVKTWEAETGRLITDYKGFNSAVYALSLSSDGKLLAGCSKDGIRTWEVKTGRLLSHFQCKGSVHSFSFLHGTHLIASGDYGRTVNVSDAGTGALIAGSELLAESITHIAASPDGTLFAAVGAANTVSVFEASSCRRAWRLSGPSEPVIAIHFSANGDLVCLCPGLSYSTSTALALSSMNPCAAQVWKSAGGALVAEFVLPSALRCVDLSPDELFLATGDETNTASVWDLSSGQRVLLNGHNGPVASIAFSPDGKSVVTGSEDTAVAVWDATRGARLFTCSGHTAKVNCIAFTRDGSIFASGSEDCELIHWDARTGLAIGKQQAAGPVRYLRFAENGEVVALLDEHIPKFQSKIVADSGVEKTTSGDYVERSFLFSPDWKLYANPGLLFKHWEKRQTWQLPGQAARVTSINNIAIYPTGEAIVLAEQGIVFLSPKGEQLAKIDGEFKSNLVAFSPNGTLIGSAAPDNLIRIWEVNTHKLLLEKKAANPVISLALFPDERAVAVSCQNGPIEAWEIGSGKVLAKFSEYLHTTSLAVYPDGQHLAASSNYVYLWQQLTANLAARFSPPENPMQAAIRPMSLLISALNLTMTVPLTSDGSGR